jgi:hypothetical protein
MQCNYIPFSVSSKIYYNKRYSGAICIWEHDVYKDTENIPKWYVHNAYGPKFSFIVLPFITIP